MAQPTEREIRELFMAFRPEAVPSRMFGWGPHAPVLGEKDWGRGALFVDGSGTWINEGDETSAAFSLVEAPGPLEHSLVDVPVVDDEVLVPWDEDLENSLVDLAPVRDAEGKVTAIDGPLGRLEVADVMDKLDVPWRRYP